MERAVLDAAVFLAAIVVIVWSIQRIVSNAARQAREEESHRERLRKIHEEDSKS